MSYAHILINDSPLFKTSHLTSRVLTEDSTGLVSNQASDLCLGLSFFSYKLRVISEDPSGSNGGFYDLNTKFR